MDFSGPMLFSPLDPCPEVGAAHFMSSELRPTPQHRHSLTPRVHGLSQSQKGPERTCPLTHQVCTAAPSELRGDPKPALSLLTICPASPTAPPGETKGPLRTAC